MNFFKSITSAVVVLAFTSNAFSQQLNLSRLFYPNVTLRSEVYSPSNTPSGQDFGMTKTSFLGLVPIQSEVQAGFSLRKKFDVKAVHTLMYGYYAQTNPELGGFKQPEGGFKTLSLGVIRLQASLKNKLWIYGGGIGISESNDTFFSPEPNLWGGAARMHILGLQTQIMYGSILGYNQKVFFVPVFGVNKRINRDWRVTAILPITASVKYKMNNWLNAEVIAGVNGHSSGFKVQTATEKVLNRQNYHHIKAGIALNAHFLTVLNVGVEAGMSGFRGNKTFDASHQLLENQNPNAAPYVGVSLRYLTASSKLSSKFTRKLGISESGLNW